MIYRSENKFETVVGLFLILMGAVLRVLPHPDNFTPVTAIALFAGIVLAPRVALVVPLGVMILSDLWIGAHDLFWLTWGSFFLVSVLGVLIRDKASAVKIFFATLGGSVLFFVLSNLGVFIFQKMYAKNFHGLAECFIMAIPFFKNSLIGDLFYSFALFGIFALAKRSIKKIALQRSHA